MSHTHTFLRTRGGITKFARVTVSLIDTEHWGIEWSPLAAPLRAFYPAIEPWLARAAAACTRGGHQPRSIRIDEIVEVLVDTTGDAMVCAAVMAAWRAWDCDESAIDVRLDALGWWEPVFQT